MSNASHLRATWSYPTQVRFGPGRIDELPSACRNANMTRPLLVTDPALAELDMVERAVAACRHDHLAISVFSGIKSNPTAANVAAGLAAYSAGGHDSVIAFGGGSALDAGKVIAFMTVQDRPMWDFEDVDSNWKAANAEGIPPIIAVPTTAGTGSEVGRAGVITDEESHLKKVIFHPGMLPAVVICDPELTIGLPPRITAATGMDALAHCLEAYCAPNYHPMSEGVAVEGMRLVKEWLPVAVAEGSNVEARAHMMAAAAMGSVAFQKGLGAIHALSHPVGALYDTHHGLTNAVVMPYVLAFNRSAVAGKLNRLAAWLGLSREERQDGYDAVQAWILDLRRELEVPATLADLGVGTDRLDRLAAMAAVDPTAGGNPVPLDTAKCRELFGMALDGRLK